MVLTYTSKNNFILFERFTRVCTVSSNFPDNPRILTLQPQDTFNRCTTMLSSAFIFDISAISLIPTYRHSPHRNRPIQTQDNLYSAT